MNSVNYLFTAGKRRYGSLTWTPAVGPARCFRVWRIHSGNRDRLILAAGPAKDEQEARAKIEAAITQDAGAQPELTNTHLEKK